MTISRTLAFAAAAMGAAALTSIGTDAGVAASPSLRFTADFGEARSQRDLLQARVTSGSIRELRLRATTSVVGSIPSSLRGQRFGVFSYATGDGQQSGSFELPKDTSSRTATIARVGDARVDLRQGKAPFLNVRGLPPGTTTVTLSFTGVGARILGPARACPTRTEVSATAVSGSTVRRTTSTIRCGVPR